MSPTGRHQPSAIKSPPSSSASAEGRQGGSSAVRRSSTSRLARRPAGAARLGWSTVMRQPPRQRPEPALLRLPLSHVQASQGGSDVRLRDANWSLRRSNLRVSGADFSAARCRATSRTRTLPAARSRSASVTPDGHGSPCLSSRERTARLSISRWASIAASRLSSAWSFSNATRSASAFTRASSATSSVPTEAALRG